jgi:hypothetical protein
MAKLMGLSLYERDNLGGSDTAKISSSPAGVMLQLFVTVDAAVQRALPESRPETARRTWLSPELCRVGLVVSRWLPTEFRRRFSAEWQITV